jgi:hypothetical protein
MVTKNSSRTFVAFVVKAVRRKTRRRNRPVQDIYKPLSLPGAGTDKLTKKGLESFAG